MEPRQMRLWPFALLILSACASFPELEALDSAATDTSGYPRLLPLSNLLDAPPPLATDAQLSAIEARLRRLRARASALKRPVIDQRDRTRMAQHQRDTN